MTRREFERIVDEAVKALPGLDRSRLLLFGGWESASRSAGVTLQLVGERLEIAEQFQGVDRVEPRPDGSLEILERVEGGKHQVSLCSGPPAVLGWATGELPEPKNNPQVGMANMRAIMPALQKAAAAPVGAGGVAFASVLGRVQPMVFGDTGLKALPHPPALVPVFVHLAIVLLLGIFIPPYLAAWYRQAAALIG